jgi:hypothetical protein
MRRLLSLCLLIAALPGCGSPTLDLAGYPDAEHDRLYRDGRYNQIMCFMQTPSSSGTS